MSDEAVQEAECHVCRRETYCTHDREEETGPNLFTGEYSCGCKAEISFNDSRFRVHLGCLIERMDQVLKLENDK